MFSVDCVNMPAMKLTSVVVLLLLFVCVSEALDCLKTRHKHVTKLRIGTYIPQCDSAGNWESKQCHASSGYCFCVDHEGNRIGSAVPPTSETILLCKRDEK